MEFIQIEVKVREERGSASMRRLRAGGAIPAVLYGLDGSNLSLTLPGADLARFIQSGSHLVELTMGEERRDAILRDVQQNAVSDQILHVDFQRVDKDIEIEDSVPVRYKGEAPGTKEGGIFQTVLDNVSVKARPRDLPDDILLDVSELHVGDGLFVRDIEACQGVTFLNPEDELLCHVVLPRGQAEDETTEGEEGVGDAEAEGAEAAESDES